MEQEARRILASAMGALFDLAPRISRNPQIGESTAPFTRSDDRSSNSATPTRDNERRNELEECFPPLHCRLPVIKIVYLLFLRASASSIMFAVS